MAAQNGSRGVAETA